jgi:hypothetical protein
LLHVSSLDVRDLGRVVSIAYQSASALISARDDLTARPTCPLSRTQALCVLQDRAYVMKAGRMVYAGPPSDIDDHAKLMELY